ncbi:MAG: ABC transporter permease subunit [Desulfurococcales archaeon]|nr:ABC transporter permease subunit [Desulfurococcales archaeon]
MRLGDNSFGRLVRLLSMDTRILAGSGGFIAFILFIMLPSIIALYVAGLFWMPQSHQAVITLEYIHPGTSVYEALHTEYISTVKSLAGMVTGFWAGFPMLVIASLVASSFISGERGNGTFDLLATKPIRRYELVLSKVIGFSLLSLVALVVVQTINVLVVAASFYNGLGAGKVWDALTDSSRYIGYYTLISWLYLIAILGLTLLISTQTKKVYIVVLGVVGYYIGLAITSQIITGLIGGSIAQEISTILLNADFSYHANIVLHQWVYGTLENIPYKGITPSYPLSLMALTIIPILLIVATLVIMERKDLD